MMRFGFKRRGGGRLFAGLAVIALLTGCSTTAPVQYYLLTPSLETTPADRARHGFEALEIGIGPVTLPDYLDRPQIASRTSANQLSFADSQRWAEPLAENFSRVLAENISRLLGTDRIRIFPWPRSRSIDWQLVIDIMRFENQANGTAVLEVRWAIRNGAGEVVLPARRSRFETPVAGPGRADQVAGLSQTVAILCQEIVAGLILLQGR